MADDPIIVDATPNATQLVVAVRQLILVASGVASAFGAAHLSTELGALMAIAGPIAGVISFALGQWYIVREERKKRAMAHALPNAIAQVKDGQA